MVQYGISSGFSVFPASKPVALASRAGAVYLAATMIPLLEARQLRRCFGDFVAVDGLDFTLSKGEILGFLGPNGAGKSTCLRMMTGNLAPDAGHVLINSVDLWRHPKSAKRHLGYLSDRPPLYPDLRVDEFLQYAARLHGVSRDRLAAAVASVKKRCGLEKVGRKLIRKLSMGYRQRVGIAQAIVHEPVLLVLDEPTVGLDPSQMRDVRELIRELGEERAVLLSSHLLPEVQSVCSRVLILDEGKVVHQAVLQTTESASGFYVRFEHPPSLVDLLRLPGIARAEARERDGFRILAAADAGPTELIARLVEAGWGLTEFTPERGDLERVFFDLTSGGTAP